MTCPACELAQQNALTGIFRHGCRACDVRAIAQSPRHIREAYYAKLGQEQRQAFAEDVSREYKRRKDAQ